MYVEFLLVLIVLYHIVIKSSHNANMDGLKLCYKILYNRFVHWSDIPFLYHTNLIWYHVGKITPIQIIIYKRDNRANNLASTICI